MPAAALGLLCAATAAAQPLLPPGGFPRFFAFRTSEALAASGRLSYEEWHRLFAPFDGIMGKVLDEEVPRRSAALPFFARFAAEHPEKLVLLHLNGRSRDPSLPDSGLFAGHWLHYQGCRAESAIPAAAPGEETEIRVADPRLFRVAIGRYGDSNEDVAICGLLPDGTPDWSRVEQVELLAVDRDGRTIRVRRGAFGTRPLAFAAGAAHVAAHVTEGPWGRRSRLLWSYNYSPDCPRDARGRAAADILVDQLAALLGEGGPLALFDGLELDVLMAELGRGRSSPRTIDTDGDGRGDDGRFDGANRFGAGVTAFLARLRQRLGDGKLIMADGMSSAHQRGFGILNGIESEGWPTLTDPAIDDWSGGLNRHLFWASRARAPAFNYINHKFREKDEPVAVPASVVRLVMAAAAITDSWFTCSDFPGAIGAEIPVWDELVKGQEKVAGWLGEPLSPPRRLAREAPLLLAAEGLAVSGSARLPLPSLAGPDLTVFAELRTAARDQAVLVRVGLVDGAGRRHGPWMSWADSSPFEASFAFRDVAPGEAALEIEAEGDLRIEALSAHEAPDAVARLFQGGAVLANPAHHEVTFDLGRLFPGARLRRLRGTQDPAANDGGPVGRLLTLPRLDALFLARQ